MHSSKHHYLIGWLFFLSQSNQTTPGEQNPFGIGARPERNAEFRAALRVKVFLKVFDHAEFVDVEGNIAICANQGNVGAFGVENQGQGSNAHPNIESRRVFGIGGRQGSARAIQP